jgi:hypothetical protein
MGAVLAGDSTVAQVHDDAIGGHVTITNCSQALMSATNLLPWPRLSWGTPYHLS